jgi:hypothetical protein
MSAGADKIRLIDAGGNMAAPLLAQFRGGGETSLMGNLMLAFVAAVALPIRRTDVGDHKGACPLVPAVTKKAGAMPSTFFFGACRSVRLAATGDESDGAAWKRP